MNIFKFSFTLFIFWLMPVLGTAQNVAPVLTASGNQTYCPGSPLHIVTDFNTTDPDDTGTNAIYIQISSGYANGQDQLLLTGTHPDITSTWNASAGKLTLQGIGGSASYTDLIAAVEDVVYDNSSANPTAGERTFSITVGEANFLPSTGHYYRFVPSIGINWNAARDAAQASTYYGLQGYLATILAADEAQLCGAQATGTGWIGGNDVQTEGVYRWVTGPEAGTVFWNGDTAGSTPNFAFWNTNEPNNLGEEDYVHITAPGVGIPGSWNDLPINGSGGDYTPQGYIVEYGGMPGDPVLHISASTTIEVVKVLSVTPASACGQGPVVLQAISTGNLVYWYADATGGAPIATGSSFTTPAITESTTYYASAYNNSCNGPRIAVTATITDLPTLTVTSPVSLCGAGTVTLQAQPSAGTVNWYTQPEGGTPVATGATATSPAISANTIFYAEAVANGCASALREPVTVARIDPPVPDSDEEVSFCAGTTATLNAEMEDVTYEWSTGETGPSILITQGGTYTVEVTNAEGCSATRTFVATALPDTLIEAIKVNNETATIVMPTAISDYEYSIDGNNFQPSNIFTGLNTGVYTAYVRSVYGCGEDSQPFVVNMIPKFFTPNNDSFNDVFTLVGMSLYPKAKVNIFDRYGKLIISLNRINRSWDGTLNGSKLPAADYWYVISLDDATPEITGHFSLIR